LRGAEAFQVLLVGNYLADRQPSMQRFATLLHTGLAARGVPVTLVRPRALVGRLLRIRGAAKWSGYVDKFLLFPWRLRQASRGAGRRLVVHICDHSNALYVRWVRHLPHLVTCHDLLAVRSARAEFVGTRTRWSGRLLQRTIVRGLRSAGWIVCDSQATRADVIRIVGAPGERVGTIFPGVSPAFARGGGADVSPPVRQWLATGRRYVLHVGGNQWYKNRAGLLAIYAALVEQLENTPPLVIAGEPLPPDIRSLVSAHRLSDRVVELPNPTDADLAALYSSAALFLFPSLAEGFGWPVLEAMACGCRVVAGNRAPVTEVGGEAATYIDPGDASAAASVVARVLEEPDGARRVHVAAGLARARQLDCERMVDAYVRAYRAVLDGNPPGGAIASV
jgi:glycosyltransferase involved in cell wall biosynthesis